jgi:hypothetical protein
MASPVEVEFNEAVEYISKLPTDGKLILINQI